MRQVEVVNKIGFSAENPVHNTTVKGTGENKDKDLPRLKRNVMVPETTDELFESLGGADKLSQFLEVVACDYSLIEVRGALAKLDAKTTTNEEAVAKLTAASNEFTFADILKSTERTSEIKIKAQKLDAVTELMSRGLPPEQLAAELAILLKKAA